MYKEIEASMDNLGKWRDIELLELTKHHCYIR